nr:uncharacterized protein LOC113728206 [Coffea arabica]
MASSSIPLLTSVFTTIILTCLNPSITARASSAGTCYNSIISFGDSLADTGNLLRLDRLSSSSSSSSSPILLHTFSYHLMVKPSFTTLLVVAPMVVLSSTSLLRVSGFH